jgi:rRNA maturation endonuclease Nob1
MIFPEHRCQQCGGKLVRIVKTLICLKCKAVR